MPSAESVGLVFSVLISRFKIMPAYIIYDNSCNLYEYAHNRSPELFKSTVFLSDGFHWINHVNCSACFNPREYEELYRIVLMVHEQKNSTVANLKLTAPHMNFNTFCEFVTFILFKLNLRELIKLDNSS